MPEMVYRELWAFKGPTDLLIRGVLSELEGPIYNLCSGLSDLGDVKVDLFTKADIKADVREGLPFRDAATIFTDPPWPWKLPERQRAISQMLKALKVGGRLVMYAPWQPQTPSLLLERAWVRGTARFGWPFPPPILAQWRRTQ